MTNGTDDGAAPRPVGAPARTRPRWRDVAVGAVYDIEDVVVGLAVVARDRAAGRVAAVRARVEALGERGAAERVRTGRRVTSAVGSLVDTMATSPLLDRIVDAQLDRTVRPLVVRVLDDVLTQLQEEPDRVRSVIREQRDSMADDIVTRLREDTAAGDAAVDRMTSRMLGRRVPSGTPPP